MTAVAIIQARMGSSRLPGKVLQDLAGQPMLAWVVRAARAVPGIYSVVIATSHSSDDNPIVEWCKREKISCFRGDESDVLARFEAAARQFGASIVMRLTADCPLLDPHVCGQTLALLRRSGCDYASNVDPPTWPDGLDCEVFTATALAQAAHDARRPSEREHVTPFFRHNRYRFSVETLISSLPGLKEERWTIDTADDLAFVRALAERLPAGRPPAFTEVLAALDVAPDIRSLRPAAERNSGYAASIAAEKVQPERRYDTSWQLLVKAERVIPLGTQTFSKSRIQFPGKSAPLFLTHGDGGRVYDVDGREYVDMMCGLLSIGLGYRDPDVDGAIRRQLNRGISFSLATELERELAERLVELIPSAEMVRFGKNGTDATSGAVRLARAFTGRDRILACGYHGWQDWYIGATSRNRGVPGAVGGLTVLTPFNDLAALEQAFARYKGEVAAVILEPASAALPAPGFLDSLRALTKREGALLIFDEVITGFRWSLGGAQEVYGVTPDLTALGKALGNGMPISALVGRADVMGLMNEVFYSATFGGETLSLAAAIAVIDKMRREDVIGRLWAIGRTLRQGAEARIAAAGLADVIGLSGAEPWSILTFKGRDGASREAIKTLFLAEMIAAGVLINASHNVCYAHNAQDIARVLGAWEYALARLGAALAEGDLDRRLGDTIIRPLFTVRAAS
jgi:glutamate-1-semialdehyde aminotransferase/spore coat polysaccharide biosynthesis protein SpsF (cytidylyltransferase family)